MKKMSVVLLCGSLLFGCVQYDISNDPPQSDVEDPKFNEEPTIELFRSVFNGDVIEENTQYQPIAVIIENSAASRPHSGLSQADIVYEFFVDGFTITRFLAIFESTIPNKIGPVRSGRIPMIEIAQQWMLPLVHYGAAETGEGNAYRLIRNTSWPVRFDGVGGLNQTYFFRDTARRAPHNAYFRGVDALAKISPMNVSRHFMHNEESNINGPRVNQLSLAYSRQLTNTYMFDPQTNLYTRYINGSPMMDLNTQSNVTVRNIIILHAPHRSAEVHRYALIDFQNEGKAEFFIQGQHEIGMWRNEQGMIRFFKASNEELVLLPGNTWIQVVSDNVVITTQP